MLILSSCSFLSDMAVSLVVIRGRLFILLHLSSRDPIDATPFSVCTALGRCATGSLV